MGMQTTEKISSQTGDAELLVQFASGGEDEAFAELVRRHLPLVLAVARRRLGSSGLAEDAAQQVFIALSRKLRQGREIPCLAAWLQKAAVYEASNLARKEQRLRRGHERAKELWTGDQPAHDDPRLDRALASLADRDRQILLLHHFEKLPFARIASQFGINEAAAQRRGHRAMEKLAKLIRAQGVERDARFCSLWLAGSLAPPGMTVSSDLITRISALKSAATHSLPWLPIAAAITLIGGGTWATVVATRPNPPQAPAAISSAAPTRERPATRKFTPQTSDEKLSPEVREFIELAKRDSKEAWEWVKLRPRGAFEFLQDAARALADRDLPAAERLLEIVKGPMPRMVMIGDIMSSRAAGNFESAVLWIDGFPAAEDRKAVGFSNCAYVNSEIMNHDYAGALGFARSPEVREWLVRQACEKAAATDEKQILELAAGLKDNERRIAIGHAASLLLQRGDPRGYELLDAAAVDAAELPDIANIALRDPAGLMQWMLSRDIRPNGPIDVRSLWHTWGKRDAAAAASWARSLDAKQRRDLHLDFAMDPTVQRMLDQP
jgi:RNA polymerase sigma factor (sigma-70 family)